MEFAIYLLKVNIAVILFYVLYRLVFERDTFFAWKRIVLLAAVVFSLFYPLTEFYSLLTANVNMVKTSDLYAISLNSINISPAAAEKTFSISKMLPAALLAVYLAGVLYCLFRIVIQTVSVLNIVKKSQKREIFGQQVRVSQRVETPFSFFGTIIINDKNYTESEFSEILLHERTHKQQWHSADAMLGEMLCVVSWFNPLVWRLKSEIRLNLEFLADRRVLLSGCEPEHYQLNLVQLSYQKNITSITNNFNISFLKKRIIMMKRKESKSRAMLKYALLVPLIACLTGINVKISAQNLNFDFGNGNYELWDFATWRKNVKVSENIDVQPQFAGGERAMYNFFMKTDVKYPDCFISKENMGRLFVNVSLDEQGNVKNVQNAGLDFFSGDVLASCKSDVFYEAIAQSLNPMPKWTPAKKNGKPIACTVKIPLQFHLQDNTSVIFYCNNKKIDKSEYLKMLKTDNQVDIEIIKNQIVDGQKVHIVKVTMTPINYYKPTANENNPDVMPEFPGGTDVMMKFISDNIEYPKNTFGNLKASLTAKFTVEKDGSINNIEIVKNEDGSPNEFADEATRIIKLMPKWKAGMKNGQPIAVPVTIPILLKFNYDKSKDIFYEVEHNPEFPGGMQELYKFIAENLKYPAEAHENGIQGRTVVRFIVEKDGSVSNVDILKGFDANCDKEAVRVIQSLPNFKPGMQNGKPVRVYYTLPINFVLQKQNESSQPQNSQQIDNVLFIVDGKEISKEEFNKIDPNSIQALNVLKNESATKLYGDKGKNGVVLITLKKT